MKKKLLLILALCFTMYKGFAVITGGDHISLTVMWQDPTKGHNPVPKAPPRPIFISLEDNILTLPGSSVDYTLQLRNDDGQVVYTIFLPAGTTQVTLPSTLSGDFEIRLVTDTYYYLGYFSF